MVLSYVWVDGTYHRCPVCGLMGTWWWRREQFQILHPAEAVCTVEKITAIEERALRKAKGRKKIY